ncbi:hypothetical protein Sjap_014552 [Stephania japonica]|uniref:AP5B1 middle domain-containing protein n=1 Tax=Stephania japonica TaxID=461633 RepID=A0AAP0II77_9MAGN
MEKPPLKQISIQEWELMIEDFQSGLPSRIHRWVSLYPPSNLSLLDLILSSILRKDFPIKLNLIVFLEEFWPILVPQSDPQLGLSRVLEALRAVVQAPVVDAASAAYSVKEQMMVSVSSIFIVVVVDDLMMNELEMKNGFLLQFEGLVELLLTVINRPNHGVDRGTRGVACECLRELERAWPCLLSDVAGHLWGLCLSERTHAAQSYALLLTELVHDMVVVGKMGGLSFGTNVPLVPFNVPQMVLGVSSSGRDGLSSNSKELRRVMAFLLECPQILTPCGMMEFMPMIIRIAMEIELQASLLKVQFSGLLYSYDPMLCHVVLMLYSNFPDAFEGQEGEIARRLMLISKEGQQHLVFRLLALHWLRGFIGVCSSKGEGVKKQSVVSNALSFYPSVFDPLALKAMKLDLLAYCSISLDRSRLERTGSFKGEVMEAGALVVKIFEDGIVSVSAFKWLPSWSTETLVAFRAFRKFLIGGSSHSATNDMTIGALMESVIFHTLQRMLVELLVEFRRLVPVTVSFIDRLLGCHSHCQLGERLLQTFDEHLLSKITMGYGLTSYFPVFDKIAESDTIPPRGLLELLNKFVFFLVKNHGPDTGLKSWSQGNKVLGICRTMLMHHPSSRVFLVLSRLLAFTCLYFPDLEIRDNARIYLRMLICIPGKKLKHILGLEELLPGISPSPHISSFDLKKSRNISSYTHLERVIPLLVKQSWSLSLSTFGFGSGQPGYIESIRDNESVVGKGSDVEDCADVTKVPGTDRIDSHKEPLRVMDSKVAEILGILRQHFSCIPDFRHLPGIKIHIPCHLRFEAEPFNRVWGGDLPANDLKGVDDLPALYATVLSFSSSAPYGSIPSSHIAFLLGEPPKRASSVGIEGSLEIVPTGNVSEEQQESFRELVVIELEPREPMPGLIDVTVEANAENGQIIRGQLQNITVGIEDMFLKARAPSDILEESLPGYYADLFSALWEACGSSSNTGREAFPLRGGKGVAAINGTQSVKLLEISADSLIDAVERHLTPFVVSVAGESLVDKVKYSGIIRDAVWKDGMNSPTRDKSTVAEFIVGPLQLNYLDDNEDDRENHYDSRKRNMGLFLILIFLPPRFHLLFQMEELIPSFFCDISEFPYIKTYLFMPIINAAGECYTVAGFPSPNLLDFHVVEVRWNDVVHTVDE